MVSSPLGLVQQPGWWVDDLESVTVDVHVRGMERHQVGATGTPHTRQRSRAVQHLLDLAEGQPVQEHLEAWPQRSGVREESGSVVVARVEAHLGVDERLGALGRSVTLEGDHERPCVRSYEADLQEPLALYQKGFGAAKQLGFHLSFGVAAQSALQLVGAA